MNLSNINPNLPQIPVNYGPSSQQIHNYVNHHIHSSQQSNQSQQPKVQQSQSSQPPQTALAISTQTQQQQQQQQQQQAQQSQSQQQGQSNIYVITSQQQSQRDAHTPSAQQFTPWHQYPTTLGTGITDPTQRSTYAATTTTTHSTPNSYTAEFYGQDDHQQSLGFGAMSVSSSIINQPHTLQAASTIQSALNHLNSSQLGIATAPSLVAAAPPIPVTSIQPQQPQQKNIKSNVSSNNNNVNNKENVDQNTMTNKQDINTITDNSNTSTNAKDNNPVNNTLNNGGGGPQSFYLAPGSANHGGSYRQTLNPAIYNAYRMSSTSSTGRSAALSPIPTVSGHRSSSKSPVVHVIAETVYRIPSTGNSKMGLFRKQDRFDKTALYKTELCTNWMLTGSCTYGNKCHFAHGVEDLKPRMRVENYKTQPCCDPAREGCRRCMYGRRCNYCHPGEAIRRPHPTPYYDKDYYNALQRDFGQDNEFPFGIYV